MKIRIRTGDTVKILRGKDRGKTGRVTKVNTKAATLLVEGMNLIKKHLKRRPNSKIKSGIQTLPAPLALSKVMVICPRCTKPTRVKIIKDEQGVRHRVCRSCQEMFAEVKGPE